MLTGNTLLLLIAAGALVAIAAYEYEKRKSVYGMVYHGGQRITPGSAETLYADYTSEKDCRGRVEAYHKGGTPVGGFDFGPDAPGGDTACHIYGPRADNTGLSAEAPYTAYLAPAHSKSAPSPYHEEAGGTFLPYQ